MRPRELLWWHGEGPVRAEDQRCPGRGARGAPSNAAGSSGSGLDGRAATPLMPRDPAALGRTAGGAPPCDRSRKGEPVTARHSSRWLGTRAVAHVLLVSCSSLVWEGLVTRERVPRRAHRHFWGDGRSCPDGGRLA